MASRFTTVLSAILHAYAFLVSGLFIPTLGAYFWKKSSRSGAFWGILCGGLTTLLLQTGLLQLPPAIASWGLDTSVWGLVASALAFAGLSWLRPNPPQAGRPQELRQDSRRRHR